MRNRPYVYCVVTHFYSYVQQFGHTTQGGAQRSRFPLEVCEQKMVTSCCPFLKGTTTLSYRRTA